jgi:integrase
VFHGSGDRIRSYPSQWERAREAASFEEKDGVKVLSRPHLRERLVHDLRRTAVRNLERAGVPRSVAMRLTGHKTEAVYRRYAIVARSDLDEGVAKLARLHGAAR